MPPERTELPDLSHLAKSHRQLVVELGHLRSLTGSALRPFGAKAGLSYTRVRRIEHGQVMPSITEVRGWLAAAGVTDPQEIERLVALAETAYTSTSPWAAQLPDGPGRHLNQIAASWEETSRLVSTYQQFIVPGLAQTAAYSRALAPHLPVDLDVDAHVAAQLQRQDILHAPGRTFRLVLTRRAWTWSPDPATDVMTGQRDRLARIAELPNVDVRLLEDDAAPMGGYSSFTIYDEREDEPPLVVIEIEKGSTTLREPDEVEHYRRRFAALWAAAHHLGS